MSIKEKCSKAIKLMGIPKLLLVLAAGIILVVVSAYDFLGEDLPKDDNNVADKAKEKSSEVSSDSSEDDVRNLYAERYEQELNELLSQVNGVGNVMTAVTLETGSEKVALKDSPYSVETGGEKESRSVEESTVCAEDGNQKSPYIVKEIEPVVKGVVIAAQGGGDATVEKEIIEAVSVLFGIEPHKIKVMKLK